jgi:hypothetical protein
MLACDVHGDAWVTERTSTFELARLMLHVMHDRQVSRE